MSLTADPPKLMRTLSASEVAELFGVTALTVYGWARESRIPSIRLGKTVRFSRSVIERMLDGKAAG